MNFLPSMGTEDGSSVEDHYKRPIVRAAPNRFTIEFLPPTKFGGSGSYNYGMRVSPITRGDRGSISSNGSNIEYEIWRKWEDCLWLQDSLELEYNRAAREKRRRLQQGKGVKKNGFYKQDQASSWESLPPGPDPKSVSQNIHDYIPKLTKRGAIFRVSPATVEQRDNELQVFVEALFKDDQPTLIKELRTTKLITEFFGYWDRDSALDAKKQKSKAPVSRESLSPSIFSSYFSASSTPSLLESLKSPKSQPASPLKRPFLRSRSSSTSSDRPQSLASSQLTETCPSSVTSGRTSSESFVSTSASSVTTVRRRSHSLTSSSGSSSSLDDQSDHLHTPSTAQIVETVPISFGHNPQQHPSILSRPGGILDALPEESDVVTPLSQQDYIRKKSTGLNQRRNRNAQIFVSPPETPSSIIFKNSQVPTDAISLSDRTVRDSWATTDSTSTYLEGLNVTLSSPTDHRYSMASVNTFMTTDSADAVLRSVPLPNNGYTNQDKFERKNPRASVPVSLSDFDMYPEIPEDDISSIYDSFPRPASFIPERSETPVPHTVNSRPKALKLTLPIPQSPISIPTTISAAASPSSPAFASPFTVAITIPSPSDDGNMLSIKAAFHNVIVMLRVSRDIEFKDLRLRIYNKFVGQEGLPLSKGFTLAVVVAHMNSPIALLPMPKGAPENSAISQLPKPKGTRPRSRSVTSVDNTDLRLVDSQGDWEIVAYSTEGTKLTLRILDTPT